MGGGQTNIWQPRRLTRGLKIITVLLIRSLYCKKKNTFYKHTFFLKRAKNYYSDAKKVAVLYCTGSPGWPWS